MRAAKERMGQGFISACPKHFAAHVVCINLRYRRSHRTLAFGLVFGCSLALNLAGCSQRCVGACARAGRREDEVTERGR